MDEAPESTKQLYTFMLKISNVIRKGEVMDFDFLPILAALTSWGVQFIFDLVASMANGVWAVLGVLTGLDDDFLIWLLGLVGDLQFHSFIAFKTRSLCCINFNKLKYVILAQDFFRSSTML